MRIIIKTTNVKLTNTLKEFIEEKINSLEKFSKTPPLLPRKSNLLTRSQVKKHIDTSTKTFYKKGGGPRVEAWVEIGKTTLHHQKGPVFWAECQMRFPKRSLRATAQRKDLKLAIVEVKDELQRQLKQHREKLTTQTKRRARVLKKELKLSPATRFYRKRRIREEGI